MGYVGLTWPSQSWDEEAVSTWVRCEGGPASCLTWPETEACRDPPLADLRSVLRCAMRCPLYTEEVHSR